MPWRERFVTWLVFTTAITVLKWWTVDMPANWDEVWAVLPGAIELRDNGFNIPALLSSGGYNQYGPATHGASPVTWLAGIVFTITPPDQALRVLHFVHFAIGGLALAEIYRFVRPIWSRNGSLVFAGSMALVPVISAQLGAVYLEVPLLASALLAANAYVRGKLGWAAGWAALATAVKPSGIYVAMAIGLALLFSDFSVRSALRGIAYGLPSIGIAAWHLWAITAESGPPVAATESIQSSIGTMATTPEFMLPLLLSLIAFFALRRGVGADVKARLWVGIAMELAFVAMFVLVPLVGLRDRLLPRYVVAVLPFAAFVMIASFQRVYGRRVTAAFAAVLVVFAVANTNGALTTGNDVNNVVLQERTNAYADLLLLQRDLLREGIARPEPLMLVNPNHWFRVQHPELGYVDEPTSKVVDLGHADLDPEDPDTFPDAFVIMHTESYENRTKALAESLSENPDFSVEPIERSRGRFTLELLVVRRIGA